MRLTLVAACVVLMPVGLLLLTHGFDGLYGQDAYAYFDYATGPLRAGLWPPQPLPSFFWPPGYPLLIALVALALGPTPLAGQMVSLVAGGLVPIFTALLARELWAGRAGGWVVPALSGLLAAAVGQLWQSSAVVMSDTTGLAAATLGAWALARYGRRDPTGPAGGRWLALSAAALAFAVLTRWAYALVAVPTAVYGLWLLARREPRTALAHGAAAAVIAGLVLWPVLPSALEALTSPTGAEAAFAGDLGVYSWHPRNALRREFQTVDGRLRYRLPNGLYYGLAPAHRFYFTPLLALLLVPGLIGVLRRRAAGPGFLLLGWPAVVYGFHAGAPWQNLRFTLAYLPPLAILLALGAAGVARRIGERYRWLLALLLSGGLVWMTSGGWTLTRGFIVRKEADLAVVRSVEAALPPDAQLLTFGLTLSLRHYTALTVSDLFALTPAALDALTHTDSPVYLLLDVDNVTSQWQDRAPEVNYRWLQAHTTLTPVGSFPPYQLLRVQRDTLDEWEKTNLTHTNQNQVGSGGLKTKTYQSCKSCKSCLIPCSACKSFTGEAPCTSR